MEVKLTITTYKINYEQGFNEEDEPILIPQINSINKETDIINKDNIELDSEKDNIQIKIQSLAKKVKDYNTRSMKLALATGHSTGKYQILNKN